MSAPQGLQETLTVVLDEVIPPSDDGRMPGAGEIGLAPVLLGRTELRPVIEEGLAALDQLVRDRQATNFSDLAREARLEVLNRLESSVPAFLSSLIFATYGAYYHDARVLAALGVGSEPPHPGGYTMEPNDLTILDPVRSRPPRYRKV